MIDDLRPGKENDTNGCVCNALPIRESRHRDTVFVEYDDFTNFGTFGSCNVQFRSVVKSRFRIEDVIRQGLGGALNGRSRC